MDKRTLDKYEREAKEKNRETWYLSWALDTNQEERDKVGPQQTCEPIKFRKLYMDIYRSVYNVHQFGGTVN